MFIFQLLRRCLLLLLIALHGNLFSQGQKVVFSLNGFVHFRSDAPQELIKAESKELKGAIEATSS